MREVFTFGGFVTAPPVTMGLACALALSAGVGCAPTEGDGNVTTEARALDGPFTGLVVRDGVVADVTVDPAESQAVAVTVDANLQDDVTVEVFEGVLVLGTGNIEPSMGTNVRVTTDSLRSLSANGEGTSIIAAGAMVATDGEIFAVGASEGGAVEVAGACTDLVAIATGNGSSVRAGGLVCARGTLEIDDETLLEVHLTESAIVRGGGTGTIRISGMPASVDQNVTDDVTVIVE